MIRRPVVQRIVLALMLTALQIALTMAVASRRPPQNRSRWHASLGRDSPLYDKLCAEDCQWYQWIAEHGYITEFPIRTVDPRYSDVAFFPGFPLWVRVVHAATNVSWLRATLLASQMAAFGFWCWFLALLDYWKMPLRIALFAVLALLVHPASFYLVAGYSESVMMFALAALLWCVENDSRLSGAFGALATATRLPSVALGAYPVLRSFSPRRCRAACWAAAILMPVGALAFFFYCQIRFSAWDLYMQTQRFGWGQFPDYLFFLRRTTYLPELPFRKTVLLTMAVFVVAAVAEIAVRSQPPPANSGIDEEDRSRIRLALWLAALASFYITAAGCANAGKFHSGFIDFIRYTPPMGFLIVFMAADQWRRANAPRATQWIAAIVVMAGSLVSLRLALREAVTHFAQR